MKKFDLLFSQQLTKYKLLEYGRNDLIYNSQIISF